MKNNIGCLGYIGYEMLPSYVGIMSQSMKFQDPGSLNNQYDLAGKWRKRGLATLEAA